MRRVIEHPHLISRKECARLLGISVDSVRRRPELFRPISIGARVLYLRERVLQVGREEQEQR